MTYPYPRGGGGSRLKEAPNFFKKAPTHPPPPHRVGTKQRPGQAPTASSCHLVVIGTTHRSNSFNQSEN